MLRFIYNDNRIGVNMKKKIIGLIFILAVIITSGYIFFSKVYMNDKNVLNRYLVSKGYSCIENICSLKKKSVKYTMNIKDKELYISNDDYTLNVGNSYPVLKLKNGNKKCSYHIDNYKRGDKVTDDFTYDKSCEKLLDEVNKYINERMKVDVRN